MKTEKEEVIKMPKIKEMDRWTDGKYLQLFALMEAKPCLWRKSDLYHSKRYMTNEVLKKIADALECPPTEVQARWRSMRQTFFKYLKKEKQLKSGSAGTAKSKEWRFMSSLRFLEGEATEKESADILKYYEDNYSNNESTLSDDAPEYVPERSKKNADIFHTKEVSNKYFVESVANQDKEFTEKGIEIGNALRRIAKRDPNMADEIYIAIRRMILDKEESLHRKNAVSTPSIENSLVSRKKR